MAAFADPLPIDAVLEDLRATLEGRPNAVLVAPPGAGKTTRVPLALLDAPWARNRKLIMLEPRRLAARGAAARMAATLRESVGETVGLRVRLGSQVSARTRIEVVTEGVFARMILDDPELSGVAGVLFDEYHERSLDADLGLALALDAQGALREDLRILVMSATLDGARVAALLGDAPVIASEGRAFPVETRYLGRDPQTRIEDQVTAAILRALRAEAGSLLVFLPGQGEILRVAERLKAQISDPAIEIAPLYGALEMAAQDRAVKPAQPGLRKIVLATAIAETSLTIEGVRVVIDSGLARVPVHEPDVGVTRLATVRAPRAAADQRRGRAGRTGPGVCYRLWDEAANGALEPFAQPEILAADLAALVLDCASWGVTDPRTLPFLDPPPLPALTEARAMLSALGALDGQGRITPLGRRLSSLPLPPRLARMLIAAAEHGAARAAADLAAVIVERGLGGEGVDLAQRAERFRRERGPRAESMRAMAARWTRQAGADREPAEIGADGTLSAGAILALAYPERIGKARGRPGAYLLANGRGAELPPHDGLAKEPWIVVADMTGSAAAARVTGAAALAEGELALVAADQIAAFDETVFDTGARALRRRAGQRLGAITLSERTMPVEPGEAAAIALARGAAQAGIARLPWSKAQLQLRGRIGFLRAADPENWPDLSDAGLAHAPEAWLAPWLAGKTALAEIGPDDLAAALDALAPWELRQRVEAEAPSHFEAPTGTRAPIDYEAQAGPTVSIRVQELFGLTRHPALAGGRAPLVLELLSPAHRPIQVTRDLPGFWTGSWAAVRSEMKGRYPRHVWPEDPAATPPTTRAKPRST
jgi:ATP-dependent helicase HrpB